MEFKRSSMINRIIKFPRKGLTIAFILLLLLVLIPNFLRTLLKSRPNILLILLDTVRQDSLSLYGNPRDTTPEIDKLAETGIVFINAYSTSSWTLPAHASMFTGLYPLSHGATQEHLYLGKDFLTFAEILREDGYHTVGFSNNVLVSKHTNLAQGFEEFYYMWREVDPGTANGSHTNPKVKEWLYHYDANDKPFFMFVHYIDSHRPYRPPEKYRELYLDRPLTPEYEQKINQLFTAYYSGKIHYEKMDFDAMRRFTMAHSDIWMI